MTTATTTEHTGRATSRKELGHTERNTAEKTRPKTGKHRTVKSGTADLMARKKPAAQPAVVCTEWLNIIMNITKITVGRLYNLGSYEHVRYELTVEVANGASAATSIEALERILAGLAPTKNFCIKSEDEIARAKREVEEMRVMPAVDWERRYGYCEGTAAEVIARYEKSLAEETQKRIEVLARAAQARNLFDNLGGAAKWKDAKLDWDSDYQDDV